jgi:hypothetical protein
MGGQRALKAVTTGLTAGVEALSRQRGGDMRGAVLLGVFLALALGAAAGAASLGGRPDLDRLAGVYKHPAAPGFGADAGVPHEDILEIVKLSPRTAYVRIHSEDGDHICGIRGVADLTADALVYTGARGSDPPCVLKFRSTAAGVAPEDVGGGCSRENCGAGADLGLGDQVRFKFSEKRPIRYMARLLASREYVEALKERGQPR